MAFQASKKRERKAPAPVGTGSPLMPSAAIRIWYEDQLRQITKSMIDDYLQAMGAALEDRSVKAFYAQDAAPNAVMKDVLAALNGKWSKVFRAFGKKTSKDFSEKVEEQAASSTLFSLSTAGVKEPRATYNEAVESTLQASQDYNNTLITGIQQDVHEKIYNAVMLSLTSPNPEEQGASGIENALKEVGGFSKARIKLISRDQTSKLYSALSDDHMRENGVFKFRWLHSSAGKVPRQSHVDKDGEIFELNDARLWEGPKSDQGPPGWAINCRCVKQPIIE